MQPDKEFFKLGHVVDLQAGLVLDLGDHRGNTLRRFGAEHEPHIEFMFTRIVVRDLRMCINLGRHGIEIGRRHA